MSTSDVANVSCRKPTPAIYELEVYERLRGLGLIRRIARSLARGFAGDYAAWLEMQPRGAI